MTAVAGSVQILEKKPDGYHWGEQVVSRCCNDELLAYTYMRFKNEKLLDILFYEREYSLLEFVKKYMEDSTSTLACMIWPNGKSEDAQLAGIGWINEFTKLGLNHARANCGMAFFRGFSEPDILVRFAQIMIEWAFDILAIDALHGVTPAPNRAAVMFSRKCGFQVVGPLEAGTTWRGKLCPIYLSGMAKTRWKLIRPWGNSGSSESITQ